MAFEGISEKLNNVFGKLRGRGKLNEKDIKEAMREVRMALLDADVNYKVAKDFVARVSEKAVGEQVMESLTPAQQVIDIVHRELIELMGNTTAKLDFPSKPPCVIMMCGLQGAGKTTHCAKLAKHLIAQNRRPLLVACDVYRPAAIDQLKIVGEKAGAHVFEMGQIDPVKIAKEGIRYAKDNGFDVVMLDTAGRLHIDETLMQELENIKKETNPNEILLVVDSMTGQDAVNVAESFNNALDITGVILTKLDGDTRGGAALTVLAITGKPVKFAGIGEKIDDIEPFYPDRMASRILGMGDVLTLIDKAKTAIDEKAAMKTMQKMQENKFDLNDLYAQFEQIEKMGSISSILKMLPGANKIDESQIDEKKMPRTKAIISSMTKKEREKPSIIDAKRKRRIAAGSGTKVEDVNQLLKQFEAMQKMMKQMGLTGKGKGKKMRIPMNMMKQMGNMGGGFGGPGGFPM